MGYFCNPININYRYQFYKNQRMEKPQICREGADPSMICFQGKYYIFASMNLSVWVSEDMVHWKSYRLPENLPLYDYAPDARVIGEYVYFCASKQDEICSWFRTRDIVNGPYEEIPGSFDFWDPNLFCDDDGRIYFYWGSSSVTPIWGVELNPETMLPLGERKAVIEGDAWGRGFERTGEDHCRYPKSEEETEKALEEFLRQHGEETYIEKQELPFIKSLLSNKPFIEGPWMDKHNGKYYLQYACPGTEFNIYADGVFMADSPLGPFVLAENNPYSYKPGGFISGAGHGSTMRDREGNLWHASTMRISINHNFERRVGIWPSGFDPDGELYCNQRYGDWPMEVTGGRIDPWKTPKWNLLSYGKTGEASSFEKGKEPAHVTDENVQTWWRAASAKSGEWIRVDLGKVYTVNAVQINFADDDMDIAIPGEVGGTAQERYIDEQEHVTRWILEGSLDGENYFVVEDKSAVMTDLPHDLIVREEGIRSRFLKLTIVEIPYGQQACISGLRVFGTGDGEKPEAPQFEVFRENDLDMMVIIEEGDAMGYNILWGSSPEKLYHSYMIFGNRQRIGALVRDRQYYIRVDAFNENGITEGKIIKVPDISKQDEKFMAERIS